MIAWKDEYSIGEDSIDNQHKNLFIIANDIYALLNNDLIIDKYDKIVAIVNQLKEYTIEHFADEEAFMMKGGYRKFLSHKTLHTDFIEKIDAVDLNQLDNGQNEYLRDIMSFVCDWLVQHILTEDKLITKSVEK